MWVNIECSIGIVCTCLPVMRPLIRVILPASSRPPLSRSSDNVHKSYLTLTDQPHIRGKLRRISSHSDDTQRASGSGSSAALGPRHKAWYSNVVPLRDRKDKELSIDNETLDD